jgi:glutathione synthase/RimK-type ligase-like ATP-grasp enzyme
MILIVTIEDDLHALAVQSDLRRRGLECHIVESDRLAVTGGISFLIDNTHREACFRSTEGALRSVSDLKVIWWRRAKSVQRLDAPCSNDDHQGLINNDCHGTLRGSLQSCFSGKWISTPKATEAASNKLLQLTIASKYGFRIPETLITQSPSEVRAFYDRLNGQIIVKPVVGTAGPLLFTQFVSENHLASAESIRACPAIYQEYIPGNRHIRLNCFGHRSFASSIDTPDLDWRPNLTVPLAKWDVPIDVHKRVREVLDCLELEMGVLDLKETPSGEVVWFEVNPQGQFLFLEGLTGEPLTEHFADYLQDELMKSQASEPS